VSKASIKSVCLPQEDMRSQKHASHYLKQDQKKLPWTQEHKKPHFTQQHTKPHHTYVPLHWLKPQLPLHLHSQLPRLKWKESQRLVTKPKVRSRWHSTPNLSHTKFKSQKSCRNWTSLLLPFWLTGMFACIICWIAPFLDKCYLCMHHLLHHVCLPAFFATSKNARCSLGPNCQTL